MALKDIDHIKKEIDSILDGEDDEIKNENLFEENNEENIAYEILKGLLTPNILGEPLKNLKLDLEKSSKEIDQKAVMKIKEIENILNNKSQDTESIIKLLDEVSKPCIIHSVVTKL